MPFTPPRKNYVKVQITPLDPETALPREPAPLRLNETPWQKAIRERGIVLHPIQTCKTTEEYLANYYNRPNGQSGD